MLNSDKKLNRNVVLSFLQEKGGVGKTTLSINVARCLQLKGFKVLLVDNDIQGSLRDWNEENGGSLIPVIGLDRATIDKDIINIKDNYDFIIIDGAPKLSNLSVAAIKASHIILIPIHPSPLDVWASSNIVDLIKVRISMSYSPYAAFILSRVIKRTKITKETKDALNDFDFPIFESYTSQLTAYPSSLISGHTVFEYKYNDAVKEITDITDEILRRYINDVDQA